MRPEVPEVLSDGRSVWVNGPRGVVLARFSRFGIDIQMSSAPEDKETGCDSRVSTRDDWDAFVKAVAFHHGVTISEEHMPRYIRFGSPQS